MDAFALLGFEARPWLDPEVVQAQAAARSVCKEVEPELIKKLDEGRRILSEPRLRLRHLLELTCPDEESAGSPASLPKALTPWFEEAARLEERLNAFLARKSAASSPLGRALLSREAMVLREEAEGWLERLTAHEAEWLTALRELDVRWAKGDPSARSCEVLGAFAHAFAYLGRWRDTVRDRAFALLEP